jgi:Zn finger protein HypA/HybF involved in hydrogenase expression
MSKAKANVWCRDCGEEMIQYPYEMLVFSCKNCKLKAEVSFEKMPVLKAI